MKIYIFLAVILVLLIAGAVTTYFVVIRKKEWSGDAKPVSGS